MATPVLFKGFQRRGKGVFYENNYMIQRAPQMATLANVIVIVPAFLAAYPDIRLEVIAEDSFVDVLAAGCDAGIRYDERLEQDMQDPAIQEAIARNLQLANALGITGTPSFVIGQEVVPGAVDRRTLQGLIARARRS